MAQVQDNSENFDVCMSGNCNKCPSYPGVMGEGLYCARGKSTSRIAKNGCSCPDCPVWVSYGLTGQYYCAG